MHEVKFKDFVSLQRGFDLPKRERKAGEYPVVASSSIHGSHNEYKVEPPGVVTGRSGSLGGAIYLNRPFWPLNTTLWVTDFKGNHPKYVYYVLQTLDLERYGSGASVPTLNRNHLDNLLLNIHNPDQQRRIAEVLSAYDDLIENNQRRIELLEEMAQAVYREWFVEMHFPDHENATMRETEALGPVPEGWEVVRLSDLAESPRNRVKPQEEVEPDVPYFGLGDLPKKSIALSEWGRAEDAGSTKYTFNRGDILFGKIRPYFHKVGPAPVAGICSTDAIVIRPFEPVHFGIVLGCVSSEEFVAHATQTSSGTKMPRAKWKILKDYPVAVPPAPLLEKFDDTMRAFVNQIHTLIHKNRTLRHTRDFLLPRLVSGEIDVEQSRTIAIA